VGHNERYANGTMYPNMVEKYQSIT